MTILRNCINCDKLFKYDPADGLEKYCEDCYYALGLGDGPGQEWQGDTPTGDQGDQGDQGDEVFGFPCGQCGKDINLEESPTGLCPDCYDENEDY